MISTGLVSLMTLGGAIRHLLYDPFIVNAFQKLGSRTYLIYPLGVLKILGILMVWLGKPKLLSNLAYSGLFWNFLLAVTAHIAVNDGEFAGALMCLIILVTPFLSKRKLEDQ